MSNVWTRAARLGILLCWLTAFSGASLIAAAQTTAHAPTASAASKNAKSSSSTPSASDIAAAKASGKVWVNLESGVYHKGGRWYGKTKNGKFMTADEAKKAGYKAAKRD